MGFMSLEFAKYMYAKFPSVFGNSFCREWLANTLQWITETYEGNKDRILSAIKGMLPYEVEMTEIERFWKNE